VSRRPSLPLLGLALVGGLLLGLLVMRSDAAPALEAADLTAAMESWSQHGPADYEITLQMGGALTDRRRIVVRDRQVVEMTVNGQAASKNSWAFWSVEGLFKFLEDEIRNKENPIPGMGVSDPRQIVLRASFDPELGYPTYFLRHLLGRQQGTEWEVVAFEAEIN
jgi:hypothetical protein